MSQKRKKVFLIDSENVGDRWTAIADKLGKKDKLIVFYTKNHSRQLEEYLMKHVHDTRFMWLECTVGNNALDYQLMGVLSYLVVKNPQKEFHIFSNDQGYQEIIKSWKERGVTIFQDGFDISKKRKKKKKNKTDRENADSQDIKANEEMKDSQDIKDIKEDKKNKESQDIKENREIKNHQGIKPIKESKWNTKTDKSRKKTHKQQVEAKQMDCLLTSEQDYIRELSKCIQTTNLVIWYGMLTAILGQECGRKWYTKLKGQKEFREEISKNFKGDVEGRQIRLIELVLQKNEVAIDEAKTIYKIMQQHNKKNLQACHKDLVKTYGNEQGSHYYKILKSSLRTIKDLK